ncbi:hypothetical protein [Bacillus cereus group sp. Bce001]|uniref:hypothetical protein n=1 Tax=Bacillus cereus group sp. Bce001 TaxID=3445260 RepID=UPI003F24F4C0
MSKRRDSLTVSEDLSTIFDGKLERRTLNSIATGNTMRLTIEKALSTVIRQMRAIGLREGTISDYELHIGHFVSVTGAEFLRELTVEHIYLWLSSMNVSNQIKLTRLKCLKSFLGRCFDNGWI